MQSKKEQNSQSTEYLCDYVYIDNSRLSHYYSQLSENGLVVESRQTAKTTAKDGGQLQIKALVASGAYNGETGSEDSLELRIDPAFSRPQETLNALDAAGYINRELVGSRLGSLILVEGEISLLDIRMLKELWKPLGDFICHSEAASIQNIKEKQKRIAQLKNDYTQIFQIVEKMPHAIQANFYTENSCAWFTLKPENMLISPEDLSMKHGADLEGKWYILGIVDALPEEERTPSLHQVLPSQIEEVMRPMLAGLRGLFGRGKEKHGLTPIMIFRTISQ